MYAILCTGLSHMCEKYVLSEESGAHLPSPKSYAQLINFTQLHGSNFSLFHTWTPTTFFKATTRNFPFSLKTLLGTTKTNSNFVNSCHFVIITTKLHHSLAPWCDNNDATHFSTRPLKTVIFFKSPDDGGMFSKRTKNWVYNIRFLCLISCS